MAAPSLAESIDGDRLWSRIMELARIGACEDGGVDRPALSAAEIEARALLVDWGRELGLSPSTDAVANLFLRYEGRDPALAPVMTGSHIDSQPTGGKFDGVFGVLAALEAVEALHGRGERPLRSIEIVAWTNEEGSRFSPGMSGSSLFTGAASLEAVMAIQDAEGIKLGDAAAEVLRQDHNIQQVPFGRKIAAFLEAHIEQGPLLEKAGMPVGIVTGIQGTRRYRVRVKGEAAHAGTAERRDRRDALMAAIRMISAIDKSASYPEDVKLTVGMLNVIPNAPSVVPSEVSFSIDLRHPDNSVVDRIDAEIRQAVESHKGPCESELRQIQHAPSLDFPESMRRVIAEAADRCSVPAMNVYSVAGHDARQLHYVCPTGMIFVPCRAGISHNPEEWVQPGDLLAGTRVLASALWHLANQG
ncbi:Zn-dependent hydrolase [Mesorhizobium sp. 1B3]|uniref:Zn-dependent hydrolase n=1 Tax=Mesorhizobium sp. 1B3 TaxID=3243599 RepID=UPI003D968F6B